jgi:hypothetical protein
MTFRLAFSDYYYHRLFSAARLAARAVRKWRDGYGEAMVILTRREYARWRRNGPYATR